MITISKEFTFAAAHHLNGLGSNHPCSRKHGHTYTVTVTITADETDIKPNGMLIDFNNLKDFGTYLNSVFDHRDLNTILEQPTSENIAIYLTSTFVTVMGDLLERHYMITMKVSESPTSSATYTRAVQSV